jgi:phosphatidylinositol alpha-1,6-mannosyltransferase
MIDKPLVTAVSTAENGGGVAVVARLLWHAFERRWPRDAQLLRLIEGSHPRPTLRDKINFTLRLAAARSDWILFSHLGLARAQARLPKVLHRPYGVFLHGVEAWCPLTSSTIQLLAAADVRLANSAYTAARVMRAHPEIGRVEPCPLALLEPPVTAAHTGRQGPPREPTVLMVGRLASTERYKGHDELIDAWPRVVAAVPSARLVIVGDGDDLPRLRRKVQDNCVTHSVRLTGFVTREALDEHYRQAALFALPSRGEGFGLVYLEAMAHGLPCLGSVHDAAREVIVDTVTGRLVDQSDADQLVDALVTLLRDEPQRHRMGLAGQLRLTSEFSFECFESRLNAALGRLMIGRQQPLAVAAS